MIDFIAEGSLKIKWGEEELFLLPQKAMYLPADRVLMLSDLHIGKSSHFRREGMAVPSTLASAELLKLGKLIKQTKASSVFVIGDLFHTGHEIDVGRFLEWRKEFAETEIILIRGNHDRLDQYMGNNLGVVLKREHKLRQLLMLHDLRDSTQEDMFIVSGHIHPGIRVFGRGRQSARLPCFHLSSNKLVLPAFGEFTGKHIISPEKGDRVFAVIEENESAKIVEVR
jgi:DNA ligase-associated metallophosphoesterase